MPGGGMKRAVIRLAATLYRSGTAGSPWRAYLELGDGQPTVFAAEGRAESDARQALADFVIAALARLRHRPIVVIGEGPDGARSLHLILAEPRGWVVHAIHGDHHAVIWSSDRDRDDALRQVLNHVGGEPIVVEL